MPQFSIKTHFNGELAKIIPNYRQINKFSTLKQSPIEPWTLQHHLSTPMPSVKGHSKTMKEAFRWELQHMNIFVFVHLIFFISIVSNQPEESDNCNQYHSEQ